MIQWGMTKIMGTPAPCKEGNCEKKVAARGFCDMHYRRRKKAGTLPPIPTTCSEDGCGNKIMARGLCDNHYTRAKHEGRLASSSPCRIGGCTNPVDGRYMCKRHYRQALCYRLTVVQLQVLIDTPCEICESDVKLTIDHDHSCCPGAKSCGNCIRGSLCHSCNVAIGLMKDDPRRLAMAYLYVQARNVV